MNEQSKSSDPQDLSEQPNDLQGGDIQSARSKTFLIVGGIFIIVLVVVFSFIFRKKTTPANNTSVSIQQSSTAAPILPQQPQSLPNKVIDAIYEKTTPFKTADIYIYKGSTDFFINNMSRDREKVFPNLAVWWISDDNFNISIPTTASLLFYSKDVNNDSNQNDTAALSQSGMQKFFDTATAVLQDQGFKKNEKNSSTSITDTKYYDYLQAFEKGKTKCVVSVSPDSGGKFGDNGHPSNYFETTVACTDDFDKSYEQQVPFLKALNIHDAIVSSIPKHEGDFYYLTINNRRTGHYSIVKKEGDTYREIASGQDYPPCELMDKNQVPKSVYGECYDAKGVQR